MEPHVYENPDRIFEGILLSLVKDAHNLVWELGTSLNLATP